MFQPAWRYHSFAFALLQSTAKVVAMSLFLASACWAQIPQASDTTSTPVPDAGHNYIHSPLSTVNPGNGSLSVRIPVRMPSGRELSLGFGFAYDSNGMDYLGQAGAGPQWLGTSSPLASGGWSETSPMLTVNQFNFTVLAGGFNQQCTASTGYIFQDDQGNRHNLDLSVIGRSGKDYGGDCLSGDYSEYATGGLPPILGTTTAIGHNQSYYVPDVTVTDGNGTIYTFLSKSGGTTWMASQVMDRNGNYITINANYASLTFNYVDTVGRTVLSDSGFAQSPENLTVAGLSTPYKVTWTTLPNTSFHSSFTYPVPQIPQSCPNAPDTAGSKVISSLELPNGQSFTFGYDTTYGLLNKITYPTGGYVRYVWGMTRSRRWAFTSGPTMPRSVPHAMTLRPSPTRT